MRVESECIHILHVPRTYLLEQADVLAVRAKPEAKDMLRLAVKGRDPQLDRSWGLVMLKISNESVGF